MYDFFPACYGDSSVFIVWEAVAIFTTDLVLS